MLHDINYHFFSHFFDTLMTQSDREIFFICDNLTKFSNDIDDQNLLLVTVPT
jgi:hypothetical protein